MTTPHPPRAATPQHHQPPLDLQHLFHPGNAAGYTDAMLSGIAHLTAALGRCEGRAATGAPPERGLRSTDRVDLDRPVGEVEAALHELREVYLDDTVWFHEPTYAAHLNCPVVIPALLAEVLVSGINSSLDTFDQSVGGTAVERRLVDWTAQRIGFGPEADGIFTSGGTQSNLQALLIARDRALAAHPEAGLEDLRFVASDDAHFSVQKAARLLGLGDRSVVTVAVDTDRRMQPGALGRALARCLDDGLVPAAVVATAGTTDFGAIDPLRTVAELARLHGSWCHVDAAYGGGLLVSPTRRHLLAGIEHADSVTIDYHKTWFQPVSSSALVVADRRHLTHVTWHADYLNPAAPEGVESPNQVDKSLQTTRRFDALKLWLTLRIMGPDQIGVYLDTVVDLAATLGSRLVERGDVELAADPQLSTVVFRYRPEGTSEEQADGLTPRIRAALYAEGAGMVAATTVGGHHWLKMTLLNPLATETELLGLVDRARGIGARLLAEDRVVVA